MKDETSLKSSRHIGGEIRERGHINISALITFTLILALLKGEDIAATPAPTEGYGPMKRANYGA